MVAIGCDDAILFGNCGLHTNGHRFLSIVEVAETADQLGFIEGVGSNLHPPHQRHIVEESEQFFGSGFDIARGWLAFVADEGDAGLDGEDGAVVGGGGKGTAEMLGGR